MFVSRMSNDLFALYIEAGNAVTASDELRRLAFCETDKIRARVAENARTPIDVLAVMAVDHNPDVRLAVAINEATPPCIVAKLAADEDPTVRIGIAEYPNSANHILQTLVEDDNPYVCYVAKRTLEIKAASIREPENASLIPFHKFTRTESLEPAYA